MPERVSVTDRQPPLSRRGASATQNPSLLFHPPPDDACLVKPLARLDAGLRVAADWLFSWVSTQGGNIWTPRQGHVRFLRKYQTILKSGSFLLYRQSPACAGLNYCFLSFVTV